MHIQTKDSTNTSKTLIVTLNEADLKPIKDKTVKRLGRQVKITGFRSGKAPLPLIEKSISPEALFEEVIRDAVSATGDKVLSKENIVPATRPEIAVEKFTPHTELEYTITVQYIGEVKVGNLSKVKAKREVIKTTNEDLDEVLDRVRQQQADKVETDNTAVETDEVWIDFEGFDEAGEPIEHADGKDYPLRLGSKTFIDGFEENLVGVKKGDEKEFTLTFPSDYRVKALADKKVTFKTKVNKVTKVVLPELNDEFAQKISEFKTLKELKDDVRQAIEAEKNVQAQRTFENTVINELVELSSAEVPKELTAFHAKRLKDEEKKNYMQRGITWEQHLEDEGMTDEEHDEKRSQPEAEKYIRTGLVLTEIAKRDGLKLDSGEIDQYIGSLKRQYASDQQMQMQLSDPRNREELASRLLTEKTVAHIMSQVDGTPKLKDKESDK